MRVKAAALGAAAVVLLGRAAALASGSTGWRGGRSLADTSTEPHDAGKLVYFGGPVLQSNRTHLVLWAPAGSGLRFDPGYVPLVESFMRNVAAASHHTDNVFALTGQHTDAANEPAAYASTNGQAVLDTDPLPASACEEPAAAPRGGTSA